jgi:hypothetical protein
MKNPILCFMSPFCAAPVMQADDSVIEKQKAVACIECYDDEGSPALAYSR